MCDFTTGVIDMMFQAERDFICDFAHARLHTSLFAWMRIPQQALIRIELSKCLIEIKDEHYQLSELGQDVLLSLLEYRIGVAKNRRDELKARGA